MFHKPYIYTMSALWLLLATITGYAYTVTYPKEAVDTKVVEIAPGENIIVNRDEEVVLQALPSPDMRLDLLYTYPITKTNIQEFIGYGQKHCVTTNIFSAQVPKLWFRNGDGNRMSGEIYKISSTGHSASYRASVTPTTHTNLMYVGPGSQLRLSKNNTSGTAEVRCSVANAGYDVVTNFNYTVEYARDMSFTETNTLYRHLLESYYDVVDPLPAGTTSNRFIYPNYNLSTEIWGSVKPDHYVTNPNFSFKDIDFSCSATWQSTYKGRARMVTAVAPSWAVMVNHHYAGYNYVVPNGAQVEFLGTNGVAATRTVVASYPVPLKDFHLLQLDSPLPDSVVPALVFNWRDYQKLPDTTFLPAISLNQWRVVQVARSLRALSPPKTTYPITLEHTSIGTYNQYGLDIPYVAEAYGVDVGRITNKVHCAPQGTQWLVDGDSASPIFYITDGRLMLVTLVVTPSGGTPMDLRVDSFISNRIEASGESLSYPDFSEYPDLGNYHRGYTSYSTEIPPVGITMFPPIYEHSFMGNARYSSIEIAPKYIPNTFLGFYSMNSLNPTSAWYPNSGTIESDQLEGSGRFWASYTITNAVFDESLIYSVTIPPPPPELYGTISQVFIRHLYSSGLWATGDEPYPRLECRGRGTDMVMSMDKYAAYGYYTNSATSPTIFDMYGSSENTNATTLLEPGMFTVKLYDMNGVTPPESEPLFKNGGYAECEL